MLLYDLYRQFAFKIDPEVAHEKAIKHISKLPRTNLFNSFPHNKKYQIRTKDLTWSNPIGIAAGLDKTAQIYSQLLNFGFGHVEVGTITLRPQIGNPKPRIWRIKPQESLRNAMGFPSIGAQYSLEMLKRNSRTNNSGLLGINIGKNKQTDDKEAPAEYAKLYKAFSPFANYLTINISSPNTPGLRSWQSEDNLKKLLDALTEERESRPIPLFLKIAPNLNLAEVETLYRVSRNYKLSGIIATNTSARPDLGVGGISGKMIYDESKAIRDQLLSLNSHDQSFEIIGVGGFSSFKDCVDFWILGGQIIQIYTAFIYQGPKIIKDIKRGIDQLINLTGANFQASLRNKEALKSLI